MAFGCGKRVIVTPAVYSRFIEYINYNIFSALDRNHIASITLRFCTILWFKANSRIPMARTCSLLAVYQIYINPWYAKNFQNRLVFFNLMILFCFIKKKICVLHVFVILYHVFTFYSSLTSLQNVD